MAAASEGIISVFHRKAGLNKIHFFEGINNDKGLTQKKEKLAGSKSIIATMNSYSFAGKCG